MSAAQASLRGGAVGRARHREVRGALGCRHAIISSEPAHPDEPVRVGTQAIDAIRLGGWKSAAVELTGDHKITEVPIVDPYIRLVGPGSIIDGTIKIGVDGTAPPYDRLHTKVEGLRFTRTALSTTVDAITAARAYGIDVIDSEFENYRCAFAVRPQTFSGGGTHHVARVGLHRMRTKDVQFGLRVFPYAGGGGLLTAADFEISGATEWAVLDGHVYAEGIDGLVIQGATFFMPGYRTAHNSKRYNVFVDGGSHIKILGCQLFEAGLEAVLLSRVLDYKIKDNSITNPGQRQYSDAVRITNGDTSGAEFGKGEIGGNTIERPTRHAISIEGPSGGVIVEPNTIHQPGDLEFFYGSGAAPTADYISTEAGTTRVNVAPGQALVAKTGTNPRIILRGSQSDSGVGIADRLFIPGTEPPIAQVNWNSHPQVSGAFFGQHALSSGAQDAYRNYTVNLKPGTYSIAVWHTKDVNRGIYSVRVDGVVVGTIDGYAASTTPERAVLTGFNVRSGGRRTLSLVMATKNGSSSDYYGAVSGISVVRTGEPT
ncbi:right-handed parallel beta-helix repeat-containing protein [Microbacterium sp. ARD31]|uniref:right-handed parallel beta-helix repeat-containing protein n=1 Tax=Microbacterium sp. ARD31 TaxID=2962576 RepID=UPI002880E504|nr:right-handed parallel beta-helix repeat-containing protein [Microbacterium sp. ARD31]MDT0183231.1 right-handed parallel beta-helix repeat-containing protein [Microbacterium sp. ARD31]